MQRFFFFLSSTSHDSVHHLKHSKMRKEDAVMKDRTRSVSGPVWPSLSNNSYLMLFLFFSFFFPFWFYWSIGPLSFCVWCCTPFVNCRHHLLHHLHRAVCSFHSCHLSNTFLDQIPLLIIVIDYGEFALSRLSHNSNHRFMLIFAVQLCRKLNWLSDLIVWNDSTGKRFMPSHLIMSNHHHSDDAWW